MSHPNAGPVAYRNVAAACLSCNNRKGDLPAEEFLRSLYREGILSAQEFEARVGRFSGSAKKGGFNLKRRPMSGLRGLAR